MREPKEIVINGKTLAEILENHKHWLREDCEGWRDMKADLRNADLRNADLREANLREANLRYADLRSEDLRGANLGGADLRGADLGCADLGCANLRNADLGCADLGCANLRNADLGRANLREANLRNADLGCANLREANLRNADLGCANLREANLGGADLREADLVGAELENVRYNALTAFCALQCPEEGAYIGWKKACDYIVKLRITEDAKRSSATTRKCRASKAEVLEIQNIDGSKTTLESVRSDYDSGFVYEVGKIVEVKDFDADRWNECSTGIHHFITRQEAVNY